MSTEDNKKTIDFSSRQIEIGFDDTKPQAQPNRVCEINNHIETLSDPILVVSNIINIDFRAHIYRRILDRKME